MAPTYLAPSAIVQYAPGFSPRSLPGSGDWVTLTIGGKTRLLSFTSDRGRDDLTEDFNAGTATFLLDNADGMLDELNPSSLTFGADGQALTPIRFRMLDNATAVTSTIWTGYVSDGWEPSGARAAATVTVKAMDFMGWAAMQETPKSRWVQFIQSAIPQVWWRGRMSSGLATSTNGVVMYDEGSAGLDGSIFTASPADARWVPSLTTGEDEDPAWRLQTAARFTTGASLPTATGGLWTFSCWFQVIDVGAQGRYFCLARTGSNTGNARWGVRIGNTGKLAARVYNAAGVVLAEAVSTSSYNDGKPHLVYVLFSDNITTIALFGDLDAGPATDTYAGGTAAGSGGWLTTGAGIGSDTPVLMDELAYSAPYTREPNTALSGGISVHLDEWVDESKFTGYRTDDTEKTRLIEIMNMVGLNSALVDDYFNVSPVTVAPPGLGDWVPRSSLAGHITTTAKALAGSAWTERGGKVRVNSYAETISGSAPYAGYYSTVSARFTNEPSPSAGTPVIRYGQNARSGRLLSRVINEVQINSGSPKRDRASIAAYGRRIFDLTGAAEPSIADPAATAIIAARKEPTYELDEITFEPWGNQAVTTWALTVLELEKMVTYTEYNPSGTTAYLSALPVRVQSESWSFTNGTDWSITLKLA